MSDTLELLSVEKTKAQYWEQYKKLAIAINETLAAISLHYMHYNFARVHQSLRVTPAMEEGLSDHVWSLEEIIALLGDK